MGNYFSGLSSYSGKAWRQKFARSANENVSSWNSFYIGARTAAMRAPHHRMLAPRREDLGRTHILASSTLEPRVRQIELEGENIFAVCDVLLFRINPNQMKKAHKRKKDSPQTRKAPNATGWSPFRGIVG